MHVLHVAGRPGGPAASHPADLTAQPYFASA
jgi:hypothetical protein